MDINDSVHIDDALIAERFVRAPGPGGQNVNKVATAVQLRLPIERCTTLAPDVRARLRRIAGSRVNREGEIVLTAHRHRSQRRNRQEARERLRRLIERALVRRAPRKPPRKPGAAETRKRIAGKRQRGDVKRLRQRPHDDR